MRTHMAVAIVVLVLTASASALDYEEAIRLHSEDRVNSCGISDLPEELYPQGADTIWVVADLNRQDQDMLRLIGRGREGWIDLGPADFYGLYNPAKAWWSWSDSSGTVTVYSQYPYRAAYDAAEYRLTDGVPWLELVRTWSGDPSAGAMAEVDSLLEDGELEEALATLGDIFYPHAYYVPEELNVDFLRAAHRRALEVWEDGGGANGALEEYAVALEAFEWTNYDLRWYLEQGGAEDLAAGDYGDYAEAGELAVMVNDYAFFLQQAGRPEEALEALTAVLLLDPDRAVAHLNSADALWDLGRKDGARRHYRRYLALLSEKGLDVDVPARVADRLRTTSDVN